ncbi:MAG: DUF58 domain-containing protein [Bacteroidia bacterium]|nr:MAG: DUF58 domain-containing protein [Bacteroidia bacterium]
MQTREMLARLRRVEIRARGLSNEVFAGEYHSAFKGRGMAFSEVREYRFGDDVRNIDWNVTARFNAPYVKVYEEERELTVMLVVDVSGSRTFGTEELSVKNVMTEMAAVLAFSTIHNNDKVGVIFFSDRVEKFIPPKKGRKHVLRIIWELMSFEPAGQGTDVSVALRYLTNAIKRRCTAFVLSDFIDFSGGEPRFSEAVKIASNKHDLVAFRVYDPREESLPDVGLLRLMDAELGVARWVNTSSRRVREAYAAAAVAREQALRRVFSKSGVDWASVSTDRDYVQPMLKLFKQRG